MTTHVFKKSQLDPAGAIAKLIHMRTTIGANTPVGYTISTLAEQTENKRTYVRPPWAKDRRQTLDFQIEKSLARLEGGSRGI
jgi:hypothetical protein